MLDDEVLHRLVAGKGIVVVGREEHEIFGFAVKVDRNRRGEAAVDRKHRRLGEPFESEGVARLVEHDQLLAGMGAAVAVEQGDT